MMLARRITERARKSNNPSVETFAKRAKEAERNSSVIRQLLLGNGKGDIGEPVIQNSKQ